MWCALLLLLLLLPFIFSLFMLIYSFFFSILPCFFVLVLPYTSFQHFRFVLSVLGAEHYSMFSCVDTYRIQTQQHLKMMTTTHRAQNEHHLNERGEKEAKEARKKLASNGVQCKRNEDNKIEMIRMIWSSRLSEIVRTTDRLNHSRMPSGRWSGVVRHGWWKRHTSEKCIKIRDCTHNNSHLVTPSRYIHWLRCDCGGGTTITAFRSQSRQWSNSSVATTTAKKMKKECRRMRRNKRE